MKPVFSGHLLTPVGPQTLLLRMGVVTYDLIHDVEALLGLCETYLQWPLKNRQNKGLDTEIALTQSGMSSTVRETNQASGVRKAH